MATKKIQNFVKNIGNTQTNKSLQFSKLKNKVDAHEEPFMFENLESDKEEIVIDDDLLVKHESGKQSIDQDNITSSSDMEIKTHDEYDIVYDHDEKSSSNNITSRGRTGFIGKSVNTALKDAQLAINTVKESMKKKGIRKPSEVTKDPRGGISKKKAAMAAVLREYHNSDKEKHLPREIEQKEVEKPPEFIVNEVLPEVIESETIIEPPDIDGDKIDECLIVTSNTVEEAVPEKTVAEVTQRNIDITQSIVLSDVRIYFAIGSFLLIIFLFAVSKFILGMVCGVVMSFGGLKIYESFFSSTDDVPACNKKYPRLRELLSPVIPHTVDNSTVDEYASPKATFSAWVNAVNSYHPSSYNLSASYSLHLSLEGTMLRMRKPKNKISSRAMSNDLKISGVSIVSENTIELLHSKIHLLPYGLVRRRMWSKRYPICITIKKSADDKSTRSMITTFKLSDCSSSVVPAGEENYYFFSRTCREKEETFRRLMAASLGMPINLTIDDIFEKYLNKEIFTKHPVPLMHAHDIMPGEYSGRGSEDSSETNQRDISRNADNCKEPQLVTYVRYMAKFMPADSLLLKAKSYQIDLNYIACESELLWLNAIIGRLVWEVFRGGHWVNVIRDKIQRKLKKLHLPYFVDQLAIVDLDLGTELPVIRNASRPYLDYRGLWVEFEVVYAGGFSMGLETKINLMKLKKAANLQKQSGGRNKKADYAIRYNTELDTSLTEATNICSNGNDCTESNQDEVSIDTRMQIIMSTGGGAVAPEEDDDDGSPMLSTDDSYDSISDSELPDEGSEGLPQSSSNKSFLQWVDKIAKSSYFLKASDNKYVLRTMEYVSNTSLQLQVDTQYLNGTLVINIPPPPSDRLWWGFKNSPQLNIKARPKVGQTEIQMSKLIEFIERKLLQEFHRAAVLPNMDDIAIPLLFSGNPDKYSQTLL